MNESCEIPEFSLCVSGLPKSEQPGAAAKEVEIKGHAV